MFDNLKTIEVVKMLAPVIAIQILLMLFCLFRLKKDKTRYLPKWAWAIIIIFINFIGPIIYLLVGRERD